MSKPGPKLAVSADEILKELIKVDIFNGTKLKGKSNTVWEDVCKALNRVLKPVNLYFKVCKNKYNLKDNYIKMRALNVDDRMESNFDIKVSCDINERTKIESGDENVATLAAVMAQRDEDEEIEFLDEDADLVQQCVQQISTSATEQVKVTPQVKTHDAEHDSGEDDLDKLIPSTTLIPSLLIERESKRSRQPSPLLVERPTAKKGAQKSKRKLKKDDDDTDYNPSEEYTRSFKKRRQFTTNKPIPNKQTNESNVKVVTFARLPNDGGEKIWKKPQAVYKTSLEQRRDLDITIPDYDDPLCLPVKCIKKSVGDIKKLEEWNNLCLEKLKGNDTGDPKTDEIVSSKNTVVLRGIKNKMNDRLETTLFCRKLFTNKSGRVTSELIQATLPQYREKDLLEFTLSYPLKKKNFDKIQNNRVEVVLTKEEDKDGEKLLVYKPNEALSAIYKFDDDAKIKDGEKGDQGKRSLKEVACCKVCAPCYQLSWRGVKTNEANKHISCPACDRSYVSVYNLLSHLRTHSKNDMRKHKRHISNALSKIVKYHYTCKICQEEFPGIKETRNHVRNIHRHMGEPFVCEIGNHLVKPRIG